MNKKILISYQNHWRKC